MQALSGDWLVVHSHTDRGPVRRAEILATDAHDEPACTVRWPVRTTSRCLPGTRRPDHPWRRVNATWNGRHHRVRRGVAAWASVDRFGAADPSAARFPLPVAQPPQTGGRVADPEQGRGLTAAAASAMGRRGPRRVDLTRVGIGAATAQPVPGRPHAAPARRHVVPGRWGSAVNGHGKWFWPTFRDAGVDSILWAGGGDGRAARCFDQGLARRAGRIRQQR